MLNLNVNQVSTLKSPMNEFSWKVLIYDKFGQDIISPLLTVKELRDLGVTLHVYENWKRIHSIDESKPTNGFDIFSDHWNPAEIQ